jgi:hypothetical protein
MIALHEGSGGLTARAYPNDLSIDLADPVSDCTPHTLVELIKLSIRARMGNALHNLRIDIGDDGVQLHGNCRSFYHKQLAQEATRLLTGKMKINNAIVVS